MQLILPLFVLVLSYKQQKFNLLREESEGYSKLIVELNKNINESSDAQKVLAVINSLIGICCCLSNIIYFDTCSSKN